MKTQVAFIALAAMFLVMDLSACAAVEPEWCRTAHRSVFPASDGMSAPEVITVHQGENLLIQYMAQFDAGTAEFQVMNGTLLSTVWSQTIEKTSGSLSTLQVPSLPPGDYRVVLVAHHLQNSQICWLPAVK